MTSSGNRKNVILQKRKEYSELKQVLKDKKIHFQTSYPAKLHAFYDHWMKLYNTAAEAMKDMSNEGYLWRRKVWQNIS